VIRDSGVKRTTASTRYREALTLAEEPGVRPLVAHGHLGLGKLMYRKMDMPHWRKQAERDVSRL